MITSQSTPLSGVCVRLTHIGCHPCAPPTTCHGSPLPKPAPPMTRHGAHCQSQPHLRPTTEPTASAHCQRQSQSLCAQPCHHHAGAALVDASPDLLRRNFSELDHRSSSVDLTSGRLQKYIRQQSEHQSSVCTSPGYCLVNRLAKLRRNRCHRERRLSTGTQLYLYGSSIHTGAAACPL